GPASGVRPGARRAGGRRREPPSMMRPSSIARALPLAGALALLPACGLLGGGGGPSPRGATARASLVTAQGQPAGTATLTETGDGVFVAAQLRGLPEGVHAMHFHAVGRCEPASFESAGPHHNPAEREHGFLNPRGQHA